MPRPPSTVGRVLTSINFESPNLAALRRDLDARLRKYGALPGPVAEYTFEELAALRRAFVEKEKARGKPSGVNPEHHLLTLVAKRKEEVKRNRAATKRALAKRPPGPLPSLSRIVNEIVAKHYAGEKRAKALARDLSKAVP